MACFQRDDIVVRRGIEFARAPNNCTGRIDVLHLDAYMPPQLPAAPRTGRPLLVLSHGGGFVQGSREDSGMPSLATMFATYGYVIFSIDYRLCSVWHIGTEADKMRPALAAQADARAAVRFARSRAAEFGVDARRIAVGGHSAGAIAAIAYAYEPRAPFVAADAADGPASAESDAVRAVISMSGAAHLETFCHGYNSTSRKMYGCRVHGGDYTPSLVGNARSPFLLQFHGTSDYVVPYIYGEELHDRAVELGVPGVFLPAKGFGHFNIFEAILSTSLPYHHELLNWTGVALDFRGDRCMRLEASAPGAAVSIASLAMLSAGMVLVALGVCLISRSGRRRRRGVSEAAERTDVPAE